ncbi:unnamed protein product [Auanema sp. JU1783]|nr:unnamed protein product [Auanema sp. JU1783]
MHWLNGVFLVFAACLIGLSYSANPSEDSSLLRQTRSFPYSVSLYRMLGHDRQLRPYYGEDDEVAAIIDGLNRDESAPRLRRSGEQLKRYACRFKFCRIFDA